VDRKTRRWVPPHGRPVRCAGQTARLFPHRTVRQNSVYGQGWHSKPADAMNIAEDVMRLFRLSGLAERLPHELSGGERQRASVARAIVSAVTFAGPGEALLLLDEPFAGLDLKLRDELVAELQTWLLPWKIPVLSVTHDVSEVFLLRAETIRMEDGRVVDQGPASRVLAAERERLLGQLRG
jgi:molybdate transport system ATP-binding protein